MTKKLVVFGSVFFLFVTTAAQAAIVVHQDFQIVESTGVIEASFDVSTEDLEFGNKLQATLIDLGTDGGSFAPFDALFLGVSDSEGNPLGQVFGNGEPVSFSIFETDVGEHLASVAFLTDGFPFEMNQGAFAVQIAALPIPTPIALLASALVALGIFGRRRASRETIKTA